ncbi:hypothetical protein [Caldicellulosiruptor changbaiensis]|uniref:hypothetical protein n=1 Tax=Caldicellulosiruptor changbaiensis TaxID=1222016 RepID=UPI001F494F15|nr:hypothetical protein [Caldicellulosiruptor changbaiensis]
MKDIVSKKGNVETIEIIKTPIIICKMLRDVDSRYEKVELCFLNNHSKSTVVVDDDEAQTQNCYKIIQNNYGWAGREWIRAIQKDKELLPYINQCHKRSLMESLKSIPKFYKAMRKPLLW